MTKAQLNNLTFNFLVMPYEDGYMAMCRETGLIRAGKSLNEARTAIETATRTLLEAVHKNPEFAPSLSVGLPLRYQILFNWTVLKLSLRATMQVLFVRQSACDFAPLAA